MGLKVPSDRVILVVVPASIVPNCRLIAPLHHLPTHVCVDCIRLGTICNKNRLEGVGLQEKTVYLSEFSKSYSYVHFRCMHLICRSREAMGVRSPSML